MRMSVIIHAHYDGNVLVLDAPADLPVNAGRGAAAREHV
jgi:hypothetical protein